MEEDRRIYTAFEGDKRFSRGNPGNVFVSVKALLAADAGARIQVFDDATGRTVDADLRGTDAEIKARLAPTPSEESQQRGPGRPRLGVIAREVTLLPRHWDWLNAQKGGASVSLRRLVEEARRADPWSELKVRAQESADRFMATMAGDRPGYEEASRALYAGDEAGFSAAIAGWPRDVRAHAQALAGPAFRKPEGA